MNRRGADPGSLEAREAGLERRVKIVAVLGAGTMGAGITYACALEGFRVRVFDPDAPTRAKVRERIDRRLERGVSAGRLTDARRTGSLDRITVGDDLPTTVAGADLIIEAAPESLDLKRNIFAELEDLAEPGAVLATNTSSLSIDRIASATRRPEKVLGLHFFNPVDRMRLVEVVRGRSTAEEVVELGVEFARSLGKETIVVKDSPGFATSRLGVALGLEAIRMLEQGVASAPDIDVAAELGYNHPMGPLRLTDLVGLDVRLGIAEHLWTELGAEHFRPPDLLRRMVAEGRLGKKVGRGFYDWSTE